MKNTLAATFFILASCMACYAAPSWLAINTEAYAKDASPSDASTAYSAYFCTRDQADIMFDATTVKGITSYFVNNFESGASAMQENDDDLRAANNYVQTFAWDTYSKQYVFTDTFVNALSDEDYLAIVLYRNGDDWAVRVLDNADWTDGNVAFDSQAGGTVGAWTAAIPEPTSALLLLIGIAGIALKRKHSMA